MENFNQLKSAWTESKMNKATTAIPSSDMLKKAQKNIKGARQQHLLTILILSLTCIGLAAFFYYLAPMQEVLSRIGIGLMIGGLIVRIFIEIYSHQKSHAIRYDLDLLESTSRAAAFYQWRKKIHGPVTFTIVALYTIGFYVLTPEFSRYIALPWMVAIDVSYLVIMVVLFFQIRKGVFKEMAHLKVLTNIQTNAYQ